MSLTFAERESVTNDYFMANGGKAVDIYFNESYALNYFLKQHKGIWERPDGGEKIRIPLEYDGQESGFYSKGATLSSDDRESVNAAYFQWKHAYANATVTRIDELKNAGVYAQIQLSVQRVSGAQKSLTKLLAGSFYDDAVGASSERFGGLLACCNETATVAYGNIAENDLQADDGDLPWEGLRDTTAEAISLPVIRTMRSDAKISSGPGGKPDIVFMTETLWNVVADILQIQQRFTKESGSVKAGFTGIWFEGCDLVADDYAPSGTAAAVNSMYYGAAMHSKGYFLRSKWKDIPGRAEDKTMKIYCDGNFVANNRKSHKVHTGLTA